jgi:hypothetical protein
MSSNLSPDVESNPDENLPDYVRQIPYGTWFFDLNGGRTEYVITIACMIGKSRMKGEKIVTHLLPYGPEKPAMGMVKSTKTRQVSRPLMYDLMWRAQNDVFRGCNFIFPRGGTPGVGGG